MPCSIACRCGTVSLTLAGSQPRNVAECCCCDCRNVSSWSLGKEWKQPVTLQYWDNDILSVDRGEGQLGLVKLREGSASKRLVAQCCLTVLLTSHFGYCGNRVAVLPALCSLPPHTDYPASCRIQTKFWDTAEMGELPEFDKVQVASDNPTWILQSGLMQSFAYPPATKEGFTLDALVERLDLPAPTVLGRDEVLLEDHFQVGFGKFSMTFRNPFDSTSNI